MHFSIARPPALVPHCLVFWHKKQENGFAALYDPPHLITRSHEEHKEKEIFRFVIIKILCGRCGFV